MQGLRDIKGLVAVPDSSLWEVLALAALVCLLAGAGFWLYLRRRPRRRRRRRKSPEEIAIERLRAIDFGDTKEAVYTFTDAITLLSQKRPIAGLEEFLRRLERYKYKKEVPPLEEGDKERMLSMIEEATHG